MQCQRVFLSKGKCSCCSSSNASLNLLRGRPRARSPRWSGGTGGPTAKAVVARKPNGYEEYGVDSKFKWDIVPWSLPPGRFRAGWSHCELQRRIPIDRITSSRGTVSRALLQFWSLALRLSLSHSLSAAAPGCSTRQTNCIFAGSNP